MEIGCCHMLNCFVTSAPRDPPTLDRTVESLRAASLSPIVHHDTTGNAFRHWIATAKQADADYVLMCQDDILVANGLGRALARLEWPSAAFGCLSLYCPSKYEGTGWLPWCGSYAWGACCLLFPGDVLKRIVSLPLADSWPSNRQIDRFVGEGLKELGLELRYHAPSLVQHVGDKSLLCDDRAAGWRAASSFVGEHYEEVAWPALPMSA